MDKFTFNRLVENPALVQPEQVKALQKIVEQYPYCQPAKILLTKAAHLAGHMNYDKFLSQSSAGMLDRKKLKQWIHFKTPAVPALPEQAKQETPVTPVALEDTPVFTVPVTPPKPSYEPSKVQDQQADLLKNLEESLAALRAARNKAAGLEEEQGLLSVPQVNIFEKVLPYERLSPARNEEKEKEKEKEKEQTTPPAKRDKKALPLALINDFLQTERPKEEKLNPFAAPPEATEFFDYSNFKEIQKTQSEQRLKEQEKIEEIAKDFPLAEPSGAIESSQSGDVISTGEADFLLSYLEQNKKKRRLKNISKDKVNSILNKFIQEEPTIKPARQMTVSPLEEDLSATSSRMEQLPASENFAQLLILQGKYSRAIEVFEELILKFPEKKPYFVSRIEDLKNNLYS